ncbi:unnamed protein product, partial [Nesidiocoris tenuis]
MPKRGRNVQPSTSQDNLTSPGHPRQDDVPNRTRLQNFKFRNFDEEVEEWPYYLAHFEVELSRWELTEDIDDAACSILFLASIGPMPFKILVDHFRPQDVRNVNYDELKAVLSKFYVKSSCIFAERRAFANRIRNANEPVSRYVNELRRLAGSCEFGNSLEERLRDQLVIGINSSKWQEELIRLHPSNIATFQEVELTAVTLERAQSQQQILAGQVSNPSNKTVFHTRPQFREKTGRTRPTEPKDKCYRCGYKIHLDKTQCPALKAECLRCRKIGHFISVCRQGLPDHQRTRMIRQPSNQDDAEKSDSD